MNSTTFDLDAAVQAALASQDEKCAEAERVNQAKAETERRQRNAEAETIVVEALGYLIAAALAPITGERVSRHHARFAYKGVEFDMWKADRGGGYGIQLHIENEFGQDSRMTFTDAPEGILAYLGRSTTIIRHAEQQEGGDDE